MHGLGHGKEIWLSHGFMFGRLAVGLALLYWLGFQLVKADLVPDMHEVKGTVPAGRRGLYERWTRGFDSSVEGRARHEARIAVLAPTYVVTYAIVFTMVAFDTIMALQPHWFSNLLGGWYFMGSFLGGHTLLALLMLHGRHEVGIADLVSPKQRHDLGKLCFGFTVFWTYLMWSQFLVIWYGNLPEETGFVFARLWGEWRPIGSIVFLGMFVIPFIGLLGVAPKKTPLTLGLFAAISLLCALARAVPAGHALGHPGSRGRSSACPKPVRPRSSRDCSCSPTPSSPAPSRSSRPGSPRSPWSGSGGTGTPRSPVNSNTRRPTATTSPPMSWSGGTSRDRAAVPVPREHSAPPTHCRRGVPVPRPQRA